MNFYIIPIKNLHQNILNFLISIQKNFDSLFGKYYLLLIFFTILFCLFNYGIDTYNHSISWHRWRVADWLVNYSGGFVRRGLSGEIIIFINYFTKIPLNIIVGIIQFIVFSGICILFYNLIKDKIINFWFLILCISPSFLLFNVYDQEVVGRKEILLIFIFICWFIFCKNKKDKKYFYEFLYAILIFVLTMIHEIFIFYIQYFIFVYYIYSKKNNFNWIPSLILYFSSILASTLIIFFGGNLNDPEICDRILEFTSTLAVCDGVIRPDQLFLLGKDKWLNAINFIYSFSYKDFIALIFLYLLILSPLYVFLKSIKLNNKKIIFIIFSFFIFISMTLPLFILIIDWGRIIYIHTVLTTITVIIYLEKNNGFMKENRGLYKINFKFLFFGILIIFLWSLSWSLNHCCSRWYLNLLGPSKILYSSII
tara:strand:- start:891 stop:2162 length:1272 start_codon:yes stop_codon:yes gene_type:complete